MCTVHIGWNGSGAFTSLPYDWMAAYRASSVVRCWYRVQRVMMDCVEQRSFLT